MFICLTETWSFSNSIEYDNLNGYKIVSYYNRLTLFLREKVSFHTKNFSTFCIDKHFEICAISAKVGLVKIVVLSISIWGFQFISYKIK